MFRGPLVGASPVSAAAIDHAFLAPGMEARAHNLDQFDPSPAVDSQLERIRELALRLPSGPEREALLAEVEAAIASNLSEGTAVLAINGTADQLVTDLRDGERNGLREVLGAKAIARHLRAALECHLHAAEQPATDLVAARETLRAALAEIPRLMLLSPAVERELGREKFAVLRDLSEKGAARSAAAGALEDRGSGRHGEL